MCINCGITSASVSDIGLFSTTKRIVQHANSIGIAASTALVEPNDKPEFNRIKIGVKNFQGLLDKSAKLSEIIKTGIANYGEGRIVFDEATFVLSLKKDEKKPAPTPIKELAA